MIQPAFNSKDFFESREELRTAFIASHLRQDFSIKPLAEDWASRRYYRIFTGGRSCVLMEAVPDHIPTATMGHKLSAFLKIGSMLHEHGIHTPEILAADEREGFVLLEDFGDRTVQSALQNCNQQDLYRSATDVLIAMRDNIPPDNSLGLPRYKDSYIRKGRQRIVDWYIPAIRRKKNPDDLLAGFVAAWDEIAARLPPPPVGFIHGDFHTQNLMLLNDGTCGVLDFQDAMWGPLPYDLANLLENIRDDVPRDVHEAMMNHYGGDKNFRDWFRVMAAQFHCRILGQVLRLAIVGGKPDYLKFIPRVQNYLKQGLQDPVLGPLADWMRAEKVDLDAVEVFDPKAVAPFIRPDAF